MNKDTIIITGGAGFVGTNLIKFLISKTNFKIISIDDYSSGSKSNHVKNKKVKYIDDLMCSCCFMFVDKLEDYKKKAVIGCDHYGFCSDDCYNRWLNPGFQKYLGKINKQ